MKAERFDINEVAPGAYEPLLTMNKNVEKSALTKSEILLIYMRGSQINGCAYCVQSHTQAAIENGEKQYRIHALPYWKDSPFYTRAEQLILAMTEEITNVSVDGLTEETYQEAVSSFGQKKVADIILAITCINGWNRLGRATKLTPIPSQN